MAAIEDLKRLGIEPVPLPWVLLRKRKPVLRFATGERARKFYDTLRFNGGADEDAALFGPKGEAWYCARWRTSTWYRDDERRRRERPADDLAEAAP